MHHLCVVILLHSHATGNEVAANRRDDSISRISMSVCSRGSCRLTMATPPRGVDGAIAYGHFLVESVRRYAANLARFAEMSGSVHDLVAQLRAQRGSQGSPLRSRKHAGRLLQVSRVS